ncbi:MAG: YraN family protein [Candidatus Omnitrophota bacterium]
MRSHRLGKDGEAFAAEFLAREGYRILATNYRAPMGEIDIVAKDGDTVVFIEVKTRQDEGWDAFEAVDRRKQRTMILVARTFLIQFFGTEDISARFDVMAVRPCDGGTFEGELLKDAFGV